MSDSHKHVLDREAAIEHAGKFNKSLSLLNEIIDYGTNLILRAYKDSPKDEKAACLIFVFLRQFLVHLDGVAILLSSGNTNTARLQLRSLWEISIVVQWILAKDTESKIRHFLVANFRKEKQAHSIAMSESPEAKKYPNLADFLNASEKLVKRIPDQMRFLKEYLAQHDLAPIDAKFEKYYLERDYDEDWYVVYGRPSVSRISLRKIAKDVGRENEYRLYSYYSQEAHGSDLWRCIKLRPGKESTMTPLRDASETNDVLVVAVPLAARLYEMILMEYRPNEATDNFQRKLKEWKQQSREQ